MDYRNFFTTSELEYLQANYNSRVEREHLQRDMPYEMTFEQFCMAWADYCAKRKATYSQVRSSPDNRNGMVMTKKNWDKPYSLSNYKIVTSQTAKLSFYSRPSDYSRRKRDEFWSNPEKVAKRNEAISRKLTGQKKSDLHKAKIKQSMKGKLEGKLKSEAHRNAMSEAAKRRWSITNELIKKKCGN